MGQLWGLGVYMCVVCAMAQAQAWPEVRPVRYASGLDRPSAIAHAGDGSGRLFVVEQQGRIKIVRDGTVAGTPFLDISSRVGCCGERGLLGLAFPPGPGAKDHFYAYYTNLAGDIVISRYRVTENPEIADPASESVVLTIDHSTYSNHNGGQLAFGPDGFLYIGTGDGGGGGDPFGNGQNPDALLAKVLRIDVESGGAPYSIPPGNPFANRAGARPEVWAYGLRNPWRFSFDRANGDLYIADVGQNTYEEINYQPSSSSGGENYGWSQMEGAHCYRQNCSTTGLVLPVAEYTHAGGNCSVSGGYVYRGPRYAALLGIYFYGDYCSGQLWALRRSGAGWESSLLLETDLSITSFGEDEAGEVYLADYSRGEIHLLTSGTPAIGSVVSSASFEPGLSPGSIATIFGTGITAVDGIVSAPSTPLPGSLNGTSVTVNGLTASIYAVANVNGREQINFQVPYEVAGATRATVAVTSGNVSTAGFDVNVLQYQPALFSADGVHAAAVMSGDVLSLYATGLGPVENQPATGEAPRDEPLSRTLIKPEVTIGGVNLEPEYAGLAPLFPGLYQINVRIPPNLQAAGDPPVIITLNGVSSTALKVLVR